MGLLKNASFFTALNLLGSIVALVINSLLAATFGAGKEIEAFLILMAFFLAIQELFREAIFSNFVPWFLGNKNSSSNDLELTPANNANWFFANVFFVLFLFLIIVICFLLFYYQKSYLPIIAPTYANDKDMAILKTLLNPFIGFFIVSTINVFLASLLIALKKIIIASLQVPATNISAFLAILCFKEFSVEILPLAYFIGAVVNLLIFLFFLRTTPFIKIFFSLKNFKIAKLEPAIKRLGDYYYAIRYWIAVSVLRQSRPVFEKIMAGLTFTGAILALDFAQKIVGKLVGVFCHAILVSSLADLVLFWDKGDKKNFQIIQQKVFKLMLLFSCFIISPIVFLAYDIASLLFLYGKMNETNIQYISTAIFFYGLACLFGNLYYIMFNSFIAMKKLKILNFFNLSLTLVYMSLSYMLIDKFSYLSLPISLLITDALGFGSLYLLFVKETQVKFISLTFVFKVLLLTAFSSLFLFLARNYAEQFSIDSTSLLFFRTLALSLLFCLCFYGGALLLKIEEIKIVNVKIKKLLKISKR